MNKKKYIGLTADCVCDLPLGMQEQCDINLVYYYIETEHGKFRDMDEITAENALEYMEEGDRKLFISAPSVDDYKAFFLKRLETYDDIIHFAASSKESKGYENALEAAKNLGGYSKNVHVIDTLQISCGMSILLLHAYDMTLNYKTVDEIISSVEDMRNKITSIFIIDNPYYLYISQRISKRMYTFFEFFQIHPVFSVIDGEIMLQGFSFGSFEKASKRFSRKVLRQQRDSFNKRLFIAQCEKNIGVVGSIRDEIKEFMNFKDVIITKVSATVSSHAGSNAFGIIYPEGKKVERKKLWSIY